jgi:phospholipid/cholesterol/gamma-HCH transport system ATP-binding protein
MRVASKIEDRRDDVILHVEHLQKSFDGREVLRDINLCLRKGENVAVLGRSGQGKSVAIKCIIGLLEPDGGSVHVLGHDVAKVDEDTLKDLRIKVGFLFQQSALYDSMTVYDNLAFPLTRVLGIKNKKEIECRIMNMLHEVELVDTAHKMPAELSGGMRKRIALARTLIVEPQIVLYDEPTTGLDPITSKDISELIRRMQQKHGAASIIITHDIPCARITSDRMAIMNNGVFVAEGTHDELASTQDELVSAFFK